MKLNQKLRPSGFGLPREQLGRQLVEPGVRPESMQISPAQPGIGNGGGPGVQRSQGNPALRACHFEVSAGQERSHRCRSQAVLPLAAVVE